MHGVLAGDSAALTWVSTSASAAYGLAYLVFVWRTPRALFERLAYALGATALLVAATATQVHHFDLVTVLACEAVLVAVVAFVCRRMGAGPASAREGLAVSFGLLGAGMLATLGMPDALDFAGNAWAFGFGGRDLMLVVFFARASVAGRGLASAFSACACRFPIGPLAAIRALHVLRDRRARSDHSRSHAAALWERVCSGA
jgi:hypothetical protein